MELRDGEEVVRDWDWEHEVVLVEDDRGIEWLLCECLDDDSADYDDCEFYGRARFELMKEAREKFQPRLEEVGLKETIMEIFEEVQEGTHIGQVEAGITYVQEVARLLKVDQDDVLEAVQDLFEEKRLDLNGMILKEFVERFRFPKEIQALIMYMIEEPLGWPNGDAGMLTLRELEDAIQKETRFDSGEDVFWEHNYPNVSSHIRVMFGLGWLLEGLRDMIESDDFDKQKLRWEALEQKLERALSIVRNIQKD